MLATCDIVLRATANVRGLGAKDALRVWRALGGYVAAQLAARRGVRVDGWGVFALGAAREPVFLHSADFLRANRVRERRGAAIGDAGAPIAPVNMAALAQQFLPSGGCSKELVAAVVAAVLALAGSLAKQGHTLRLSWLPMGEWRCDGDSVGFAFLAEFQAQTKLLGSAPGAAKVGQGAAKAPDTPHESCEPTGDAARGAEPAPRALSAAALSAHTASGVASSARVRSTASARRAPTLVTSSASRTASQRSEPRSCSRASTASAAEASKARATRDCQREGGAAKSSSARRIPSATGEARADRTPSTSSASVRPSTPGADVAPRKKTPPAPPRETWAELSRPQDAAAVARVKSKLVARCGDNGLNSLRHVLQAMDASGDGALSPNELKFGLRDLGVELSASELAQVVEALDRNRDGTVDVHELLHALRGDPLAGTRLSLVRRAFALMDVDGGGVVSVDDVRDNYDVSSFPTVRAKKKSKQQALAEFLRHWQEVSDATNGAGVPLAAFLGYYENVSACVAEDSDFELLMRQTWHVAPLEQHDGGGGDEGGALEAEEQQHTNASAQASRWTNTAQHPDTSDRVRSDGAQHGENAARGGGRGASLSEPTQLERDWRYLQRLIVPSAGAHPNSKVPTVDDVSRRLGANRVWGDGNELLQVRVFARALTQLDRQLAAKDALLLAQRVACSFPSTGDSNDSIALVELHRWLLRHQLEEPASAVHSSSNSTQPNNVVTRVRTRLLQRIARSSSDAGASGVPDAFNVAHVGLNGLQRCLKLVDTNGDKRLTKDELQIGLRKFGVDVTFHELDYLFTYFDADRSGCVSVDEFLAGMRGEMNARRTRFVALAFDLLDTDRDGTVTLDELAAAYDASQHPDVVSGRLSVEDALRAFAAQWESEKERDGLVTRREFETYYKSLSASIDSDDYFELMMRNAWHIAGGEGACANSTNRRVLVTRSDQTQSIEELKNDLGIRAGDHDRMRAMLATQGVAVARDGALDTFGACAADEREALSTGTGRADRPPASRLDKPATLGHKTPSSSAAKERSARAPPGRAFHRRRVLERAEEDAASVGILPGKKPQLSTSSGSKQRAAATDSAAPTHRQRLEAERGTRQRAAQLIQRHFRGFKARKFVECVKRRLALERQRAQREHAEQASGRKKVLRAALRTHHGF